MRIDKCFVDLDAETRDFRGLDAAVGTERVGTPPTSSRKGLCLAKSPSKYPGTSTDASALMVAAMLMPVADVCGLNEFQ
jgi:hypothetical protein